MKKLTLVLSFLFMMASYTVSAQSNTGKFDDESFEKNKELKSDMKKLHLTSTQEVGFKEITKKYLIKYDALMEANMPAEEREKKINKNNEQKSGDMKDLLNDEQFEVYSTTQKEREQTLKNIKKV